MRKNAYKWKIYFLFINCDYDKMKCERFEGIGVITIKKSEIVFFYSELNSIKKENL